jgi:hypothetical protein
VHAPQLQAGVGKPLLQIADHRRVVIVEVRARGEHLDHFEPVRRDRLQVIAGEAFVMEEMRRHPERSLSHKPKPSLYWDRGLGTSEAYTPTPCRCGPPHDTKTRRAKVSVVISSVRDNHRRF